MAAWTGVQIQSAIAQAAAFGKIIQRFIPGKIDDIVIAELDAVSKRIDVCNSIATLWGYTEERLGVVSIPDVPRLFGMSETVTYGSRQKLRDWCKANGVDYGALPIWLVLLAQLIPWDAVIELLKKLFNK